MMRLTLVATGCAAVLTALPAYGNEPPPLQADPISLTRNSPSVVGFGNTPGDIYGEVMVPVLPGGWDVGGPGPVPHVADAAYGLQPMVDNNDGHSNGEVDPNLEVVIYFSGDVNSFGLPQTDYEHQAMRNQAAGDRFVSNGAGLPPAVVMSGASGGPSPLIVGPIFPGATGVGSPNLLSANQNRYNEIPSLPPMMYNSYVPPPGAVPMDDMDALELFPFNLNPPPGPNTDLMHDTPVYFSLDVQSPSLQLPLMGPADVLLAQPATPAFGLFAPAPTLGLSLMDEVDALAVWDIFNPFQLDAQVDMALFSLAPGSLTLAGPNGIHGDYDDLSPADIFVTDFSGVHRVYMTAATLGMQFTDNIDALDVEIFQGEESVEVFEEIWELPAVAGDLNGDGFVGLDDLDLILQNWNLTVPPGNPWADPNGDGFIGLDDLDIVLNNWNMGIPPPAEPAIPEPGSVLLMVLGSAALMRRRG